MKTQIILTLFSITIFCAEGFATEPSNDPVHVYRQRQATSSPDSVLRWLKKGNQRFASGNSVHGGYPVDARERVRVSSSSQRPLAVVLSCIDSRTAPELVFDTSVGDMFTTRVGGNVISNDVLGSLEVSVASGVKLIVILGHKDCGAVKGACRNIEFGHLTDILKKVKPAIESTNNYLDSNPELSRQVGERIVSNRRYIAEISHSNAVQSLNQVLSRSEYIREQVNTGKVKIVSAIFDVDSGKVNFDL